MKSETVVLVKFGLTISLLLIIACAANTGSNKKLTAKKQIQEFFDSKINIMTYDDALMQWGEPSSIVEGSEIFVVTWRKEKSSEVVLAEKKSMVIVPVTHGFEFRLTFDKDTNKLIKWDLRRF